MGIYKSEDPAPRARAIVEATTHFNDPDVLAKVSRGLGDAMPGFDMKEIGRGGSAPDPRLVGPAIP